MKKRLNWFLILTFLSLKGHLKAQILEAKQCWELNNAYLKKGLIETFGNDWYQKFCEQKGKFFFVAIMDTSGRVLKITNFQGRKGITPSEFEFFKAKLEKRFRLCISNNNPELSEKDFLNIVRKGNFTYTFMYKEN